MQMTALGVLAVATAVLWWRQFSGRGDRDRVSETTLRRYRGEGR